MDLLSYIVSITFMILMVIFIYVCLKINGE